MFKNKVDRKEHRLITMFKNHVLKHSFKTMFKIKHCFIHSLPPRVRRRGNVQSVRTGFAPSLQRKDAEVGMFPWWKKLAGRNQSQLRAPWCRLQQHTLIHEVCSPYNMTTQVVIARQKDSETILGATCFMTHTTAQYYSS